jgi:hypothetical protein
MPRRLDFGAFCRERAVYRLCYRSGTSYKTDPVRTPVN